MSALDDDRLLRIAEAHAKDVDDHGGTWGDCVECGHRWPCPSHRWATADPGSVNINCAWELSGCEFPEHHGHPTEADHA